MSICLNAEYLGVSSIQKCSCELEIVSMLISKFLPIVPMSLWFGVQEGSLQALDSTVYVL